jgi:hypothetical protein
MNVKEKFDEIADVILELSTKDLTPGQIIELIEYC